MEVKIGIQYASRELVLESAQSADEVLAAVEAALGSGPGGILKLVDEKGRRVVVPVEKLAYVEIEEVSSKAVGFAKNAI